MKMNQKMTNRPEAELFDHHQLKTLQQLVRRGESHTLEFKRKANFPEKIIREIVAFANTDGGKLLIGIGDDGAIAGVKFPDEESHVIRKALDKYCRPSVQFTEYVVPVGDHRFVLVFEIPPSDRRPHYITFDGIRKESFVRDNDKSIRASREVVEIIKRKRKGKDIGFSYGEKEGQLIQFLSTNDHITLSDFVKLSGLNRYKASRKLILLVLANVLNVVPSERGDRYLLKSGMKSLQGGM